MPVVASFRWRCALTRANWPDLTRELNIMLRDVRAGSPEVMRAFSVLAQSALVPKALDTKAKELIALAIS